MNSLNLLLANKGKMDSGEEDFTVLALTLPMEKDLLKERLAGIYAEKQKTIILRYKFTGEYLKNFKVPAETNIFDLNLFMNFIETLDDGIPSRTQEFRAILEYEKGTSFNNIIQAFKANKYTYFDAHDDFELGYCLVANIGNASIPPELEQYFDFEEYGENHKKHNDGDFTTYGYVERS